MKQWVTTAALCCTLVSPFALADGNPTLPNPVAQAGVADIWLDFITTVNEPATIPIDTNGHEAFITVKNSNYGAKGNIEVSWNGTAVNGGSVIKSGSSVVFHVKNSGTLTIKNLNQPYMPSNWNFFDGVIEGDIIINIL